MIKSSLYKIYTKFFNRNTQKKGGWLGLRILPKVDVLIDIGIGHQGTEGLYEYFPESRKIFIDPLEETRLAVDHYLPNNSDNVFYTTALGSSEGEVNLIVRHPISRSGAMEIQNDDSAAEIRVVPQTTLDKLLSQSHIQGTIGIKIDAEGFELEILKGGGDAMRSASFIILELPIDQRRFKNGYSFEDAIFFMSKHGYQVVAIRPSGDGTNHCDVAFINVKINAPG